MGVLESYWTGKYYKKPDGTRWLKMKEYTWEDVEDPGEWWQVPGKSALARKLRAYYPWCEPIVGKDGELCGVLTPKEKLRQEEREKKAMEKEKSEHVKCQEKIQKPRRQLGRQRSILGDLLGGRS
jgi:hypothetical protein